MKNNSQRGFTIVETMIAMVVGLLIMAAVYAMINLGQSTSANIGRRVMTQQDARAVLDLMAMEIRMASYNPSMSNAVTWGGSALIPTSSGIICNVTNVPSPFTVGRKGIQVATENNLTIAMDLNNDRKIGGKDLTNTPIENEYIRYEFDEDEGAIKRAVSCGGLETILGGNAASSVVVNNEEPSLTDPTPLFQYFNSAGQEITATVVASPDAATGGGGIQDIRRIRINIVVDVESADKLRGAMKVKRRTYSTDVLVRNHGLNVQ